MKGIVFTELLTFIESGYGYEMVDEVITEVNPETGGAYTSVGTYSHQELVQLMVTFSSKAGLPVSETLRLFGHHLFQAFLKNYPAFFKPEFSTFDFLMSIDNYIHIEVAKLYPDAELPRFTTRLTDSSTLEMVYTSDRRMAPLALGLIERTLEHYNEKGQVTMEMIDDEGSVVKFSISKTR